MSRSQVPSTASRAPEEIISTHESADFDAFASAVAAQKLYPNATIAMGRALAPEVLQFLTLHKDRFHFVRDGDVDQARVQRWILVDVRRAGRLAGFTTLVERAVRKDPSLAVHIYDHHRDASDDLHGEFESVANVGAAVTLLIERFDAEGVSIDPMEATLFALGIHADTGSLVFPSTTARDVRALAWCIEQGASPRALRRYLKPRLTGEQLAVLVDVLEDVQVLEMGGIEVGVALVTTEDRCPNLAVVVTAALELGGYDALIVVNAARKRKVDVVGRSASRLVDVGAIVGSLGGGGHRTAAAASVPELDPNDLVDKVIAAVRQHPPVASYVRDIMTTPVDWVPPDMTLERLADALQQWNHTGAPVVRDGELIGIVSRRDIERARRGGRLHLPVSSHMSQDLKTIEPDDSLESALRLMEEADVGRLPVLEDQRLVGILARSDVLGLLYARKPHGE